MNHIEGLTVHPEFPTVFLYRGYSLTPNLECISEVHIGTADGDYITTEHTDVAISIIDSWLNAP